jgi:hypothetical protein
MLNDVERRRFFIHPARKDPLPTAVGLLHVQLDERSGQPLIFPRRAGFAGAQADDRVLDLERLAGLQGQVADNAVALIEKAQHGDPLGHRRHAGDRGRARNIGCDGRGPGAVFARLAIAAAHHKRGDQHRSHEPHAQSGFHA